MKGDTVMVWWSIGAIVLAIVILVVIQNLTDSLGSRINCQAGRLFEKRIPKKDDRSCAEDKSQPISARKTH